MRNKVVKFYLAVALISLFSSSVYALNIVQIAMSAEDIPFLLDDKGQVWAFRNPLHLEEPIKLPNLKNIKTISPYMALDAKGQVFTWSINLVESGSDEGIINDAVYTTPQKVEGLQAVTMISSSNWHRFAVVVGNRDVVEWSVILNSSGSVTNGPVRSVISMSGIKAMVMLDTIFAVLSDDGVVSRWGMTPRGMGTEAIWERKLQFQTAGAKALAASSTHTVILSDKGVPQFWGGCDFGGIDRNRHPWSPEQVKGADGFVVDVIGIGINTGNDNVTPDAFIKRDGAVWAAYAPLPNGMSGTDCYRSAGDKRQWWQLTAGSAAAIQVVASDSILMLDADHKLWTTADSWMNTEFHNVPINLK